MIRARDFSEFITDLDHGQINQALSDKLAEVVAAVADTGKDGELTIKLTIKREGKMATVGCTAKTKVPEHALHGTLFYFGQSGLVRDDPKQISLPSVPSIHASEGEVTRG